MITHSEPVLQGGLSRSNSAWFRISFRAFALRFSLATGTCAIVAYVNPHSLIGYWHFLAAWILFFVFVDRREVNDFVNAYMVNALLTALYVLVQVHYYPDSYGCTSPFGSQTDDSHFFSLVADKIPENLEVRPTFYLYTQGFSSLVRLLTPFQVGHPLDVLFFLSGVAGMVCVYTKQFTVEITSSTDAGRTAFYLCLFCPLMLMNGGAVFVRDTFVAGLFMMSLCCINRNRYLLFVVCFCLQYLIRPGTALLIVPLYGLIFLADVLGTMRARSSRVRLGFVVFIGVVAAAGMWIWRERLLELMGSGGINLSEFRREGLDEVIEGGPGRGAFLWIQGRSLFPRLLLGTAYMYLVPFYNLNDLVTAFGFDTRICLTNLVYPIWVIPINAWVVAALLGKNQSRAAIRGIALALAAGCLLIGVFSLQSRHKVVIQPLFYVLAASGCHFGARGAKILGYCLSMLWFGGQLVYFYRR